MSKWKDKITEKIQENNLDEQVGEVLWKVAEDSANYSFNKSHSISYAILAAITTYLKFKHPQEFFLSLLRMTKHEPDSHAEISLINQELCLFNMKLLPPDLSKSDIMFEIEGRDIRFGVNSIKGVSEKTLESLVEFRKAQEVEQNKYDVFITAKQSGLNIGVLSGLVQGGMMDSFCDINATIPNRCRLVLEAQAFNILTDREKRNFIELGERFDYDVLKSIHTVVKDSLVADDGKPLMKDSRFNTFKKKYDGYKKIYEKNKDHLKFANWFFERKYLGYSHSTQIKDVFENSGDLCDTIQLKSINNNDRVKLVGVVTDCISRTSSAGNKYMRVEIQDDFGRIDFMLINNRRCATLDNYLNNGGKKPKEEQIVFIHGSKGEDIIFGDKITILDEKIYTKLSEIK
jgi:DNA polymerase III alpha subunit